MIEEVSIRSKNREQLINVDSHISEAIRKSGIQEGLLTIFVPHTTAGVTINENADPSVVRDILYELGRVIPRNDQYQHAEGNSDAHIKASLMGNSETVVVSGGKPLLGIWQSVYFCEFDGPRTRRMIFSIK
ncbi:MAG: secondary thiamine-phosphate synthase enzyme YjbQ [Spirochaetota bacterium]